jgi:hypothetical protein
MPKLRNTLSTVPLPIIIVSNEAINGCSLISDAHNDDVDKRSVPADWTQLRAPVGGIVSDTTCYYCTNGTQIAAMHFVMPADGVVRFLTIWGGMFNDSPFTTAPFRVRMSVALYVFCIVNRLSQIVDRFLVWLIVPVCLAPSCTTS